MENKQITEDMAVKDEAHNGTAKASAKGMVTLIPYIVALCGSILAVAANFIKYIKVSGLFTSEITSIFKLIKDTLDNSDEMLVGVEDKIAMGALIAAIIFSLLVVLFVAIRKMIPAIIFAVLAFLPLLIPGSAYIHYIGLAIALVGAIWYKIAVATQNKK